MGIYYVFCEKISLLYNFLLLTSSSAGLAFLSFYKEGSYYQILPLRLQILFTLESTQIIMGLNFKLDFFFWWYIDPINCLVALSKNMYSRSVTEASAFTPKVSNILGNLGNSRPMSLTREDRHNYTMNFKKVWVIQRDQLLKLGILKDS